MVQSIQNETRLAVQAMEVSNREVDAGIERTAMSGKALAQIIEMADHVGEMTSQIATAVSRQSGVMTTVNTNVGQISGLTQESSGAAQQTAKACADLSNLASDLQRLVQLFKIEEENYSRGYRSTTKSTGYKSMSASAGE
jgi:methyl-accepting chemotaxis protein